MADSTLSSVRTYLEDRAAGSKPSAPKFGFTKKRLIDLPTPYDRPYAVYDTQTNCLRCQVSIAGTKSLVVVKKPKGGYRPVSVTICKLGDIPIDEVRNRANEAIGLLTKGINPNEQAKKERESEQILGLTLEDAFKHYLFTRMKAGKIGERTKEGYKVAIDRDMGDWKPKPLASITRTMVLERFQEIEDEFGHSPATRAAQVLRATWIFSNEIHHTDDNPLPFGLPPTIVLNKVREGWSKPGTRDRKVSADQLPSWFEAVRDLVNGPGDGAKFAGFLEFVMLTGVRRREAGFLRWDDVDLTKRTMTFRATKNHSDHTLPITDRVLEILKAQPKKGSYVFGDCDPKKAIARVTRACGVEFSTHDLRRSFASLADKSGAGQYAIKAILNHSTTGDVTGSHYSQYDTADLREPLQAIETHILSLAKAHDARILEVVK